MNHFLISSMRVTLAPGTDTATAEWIAAIDARSSAPAFSGNRAVTRRITTARMPRRMNTTRNDKTQHNKTFVSMSPSANKRGKRKELRTIKIMGNLIWLPYKAKKRVSMPFRDLRAEKTGGAER